MNDLLSGRFLRLAGLLAYRASGHGQRRRMQLACVEQPLGQQSHPTGPMHVHGHVLSARLELREKRSPLADCVEIIDLPRIRQWVQKAGYRGFTEVEIFSTENWWKRPGDEVLRTCIERFNTVC